MRATFYFRQTRRILISPYAPEQLRVISWPVIFWKRPPGRIGFRGRYQRNANGEIDQRRFVVKLVPLGVFSNIPLLIARGTFVPLSCGTRIDVRIAPSFTGYVESLILAAVLVAISLVIFVVIMADGFNWDGWLVDLIDQQFFIVTPVIAAAIAFPIYIRRVMQAVETDELGDIMRVAFRETEIPAGDEAAS